MSASDPIGGNKFWFNGVPFSGVNNSATNTAVLKYWLNGVPMDALFPASGTQQAYVVFSLPQHSLSQVVNRIVSY